MLPAREDNFKRLGKDRKARAIVQAWWVVSILDFAVSDFAEIVLFGVHLWCKTELFHDRREEEEELCPGKILPQALSLACRVESKDTKIIFV